MSECCENGSPNAWYPSRQVAFFGHQFRDPAPNRCKAAPDPLNHRFFIKIGSQSHSKTHPSEFSVPFATFVENLGAPTWLKVSHTTFFPFPCKPMGRTTLLHFLHILRGAPMSRRKASSIYIHTHPLQAHPLVLSKVI